MKLERILTAIVAALTVLGAAAPAAWAQNVAPVRPAAPAPAQEAPAGTTVVVIDLQQVFDKHIRFKAEEENLKKDSERLTAKYRADQKELEKMVQQLKTFKPGAPDYKRQEEAVAQFESNVRVQYKLEGKELAERQAKLMYSTYLEVLRAVESFSMRHGIGMVIQFQSDKIDEANPQSIMRGISRPVVYQRNLDITGDIIQIVNAGTPQPKPRVDEAKNSRPVGPAIPRPR